MRHTRIAAAIVAAAASVILVVTVSGCSSSAGTTVSLGSAKQKTIAIERTLAGYVPSKYVTSSNITQDSKVIFPCLGHSSESYWPGSTTLSLKNGVNTKAVLSAIAAKYTNTTGWTVFTTTGSDGNNSLDIKAPGGYSFTVEFDQGPVFSITALSACFSSAGLSGKSSY